MTTIANVSVEGDATNKDGSAANGRAAKLPIIIVPGFHNAVLTDRLVRSLPSFVHPMVAQSHPTSPLSIYDWMQGHFSPDSQESTIPLVGISFSAGTVGIAGALALWQQQGGRVSRLIAVDGWGVPILGVPVTRLSHDKFTHVSSLPFGAGDVNFYANPAVAHLDLWSSPESVIGQAVQSWQLAPGTTMSAADFLRRSLRTEWNKSFSWRTVTYR